MIIDQHDALKEVRCLQCRQLLDAGFYDSCWLVVEPTTKARVIDQYMSTCICNFMQLISINDIDVWKHIMCCFINVGPALFHQKLFKHSWFRLFPNSCGGSQHQPFRIQYTQAAPRSAAMLKIIQMTGRWITIFYNFKGFTAQTLN